MGSYGKKLIVSWWLTQIARAIGCTHPKEKSYQRPDDADGLQYTQLYQIRALDVTVII